VELQPLSTKVNRLSLSLHLQDTWRRTILVRSPSSLQSEMVEGLTLNDECNIGSPCADRERYDNPILVPDSNAVRFDEYSVRKSSG
jgi:hypothetical protein